MRKEHTMKKLFRMGIATLLLAGAAHACEDLSGPITAIDAPNGTIEVSGVTILAKDAKVRNLLFPSRLSRLHAGRLIEA